MVLRYGWYLFVKDPGRCKEPLWEVRKILLKKWIAGIAKSYMGRSLAQKCLRLFLRAESDCCINPYPELG
jgi:hypothetical protein